MTFFLNCALWKGSSLKNKFFNFLFVLTVVMLPVLGFAVDHPACQVGYYDDNGECKKCPSSTTTEDTGATSIEDCKCKAGFGANAGSVSCVRCPIHKYKPTVGNYRCIYCPAGEYTNSVGATSCKSCSLGHCCAYGEQYKCKRGTYAENSNSACRQVVEHIEIVNSEEICSAKKGGICHGEIQDDLSVYDRGVCPSSCNLGCTTEGEASVSSSDCIVKTAKEFCVGAKCFSWSFEIAQQPLSIDTGRDFSCPTGVNTQ